MKKRRVFFALTPDDQTQAAIYHQLVLTKKALTNSKIRWIKKDNLHLTLCFIGSVNNATLTTLIDNAKQIQFTEFSFQLDVSGYFKKPKIIWLGCKEKNESLNSLATNIKNVAEDSGIPLGNPTFKPHITLARNCNEKIPELKMDPILWIVKHFCLMESISVNEGVQYKVIHQF